MSKKNQKKRARLGKTNGIATASQQIIQRARDLDVLIEKGKLDIRRAFIERRHSGFRARPARRQAHALNAYIKTESAMLRKLRLERDACRELGA